MIRLTSAIFCLIFFTFYISSNLVGLGRLFESLLGISYYVGISIGVVIVFYTLFGGFVSMAWVDFFQGLFLLAMLLLVPVIALAKIGGIGAINHAAALKHISLDFVPSFTFTTLTSLGWGLGYFGMPHVLTKFMGIDDASKMKRAQYIGLTWQILALSGAVIVGLVGIAYFPQGLARPELVFVTMVQDLFSPFIAGFILCSVLAATINLVGAQVLVSASIITEDFFKRWVAADYSEHKMVWLSRASVVVLCGLAYVAAATTTQSIYNLVKYAWSGLGCTFGPVLLLALHSKVTNRNVALAGIITGGVTGVLWQHVDKTIPSMIAGYVMSFVAMAIVVAVSQLRQKS
jgi:sodium/proline symporter